MLRQMAPAEGRDEKWVGGIHSLGAARAGDKAPRPLSLDSRLYEYVFEEEYMGKLCWEDVKEGQEIPGHSMLLDPLREHLQTSGSQDWHRQHHDVEFAKRQGVPTIFMNTGFTQAVLSRVITDWMGDEGWLKSFRMEMRKMNLPGDTMVMKGKVAKKWQEDGLGYVECELWAENERDGVTTPGKAVVVLPLRAGSKSPIELVS